MISGFYKLTVQERAKLLSKEAALSPEEEKLLCNFSMLGQEKTDMMIENVVSTFPLPFGIALNFKVNGRDCIVPMAVEESSVVAACSLSAKLCRDSGGFTAAVSEPIMIGQVFLFDVKDLKKAEKKILSEKRLYTIASLADPVLSNFRVGFKKN